MDPGFSVFVREVLRFWIRSSSDVNCDPCWSTAERLIAGKISIMPSHGFLGF
jgi:hypothetical protein